MELTSGCYAGGGRIQWDFIHGLFESAIYGGRVDNMFDTRVMVSYLHQFFDNNVISEGGRGGNKLGPLKMPRSATYRVRIVALLNTMGTSNFGSSSV